LRAVDYLLPQTRVRVFLKGVRRCLCETVPAALSAFGSRHLREVLGKIPNQIRTKLGANLQDNLRFAEKKIRNLVRIGRVKLQDLVVVPIDRAPGKVYKQNHSVNCAPTLTTHNVCLPDECQHPI
jgi:site-specific DNA-cytosine methylase